MKFIVKHRKSQAAMEFLMTYGWATLVVLAAIAALAYFGVLSPEKFMPEKCVLEPGLTCTSSKVTSSSTILFITNGLGRTITIDSISVGACSKDFSSPMQSGNTTSFELTGCNNGLARDKFKGDITLKYTEKDSGLSKTAYGNIVTKIEE